MSNDLTPENIPMLAFAESPVAHLVSRYRRAVEVNRALERLFGVQRDQLIGRSVQRLYPSTADFIRIGEKCESLMKESGELVYEDERFMQSHDQQVFWARAKGVTLSPEDPFALMIWTFERVGERKVKSVNLTPRERQIAPLIGNGMTSKQIGAKLGISHRTVDVHRARLMKKFNVNNAAELVSQIVTAQ